MNCIICQQSMKFKKILCSVKGKQGSYNMKRYECPHCGYVETIAGDHNGDLYRANLALEDIKRMYKQQEELNRI